MEGEAHSMRGRGWVKFEEEAASNNNAQDNQEAPGSLEVSEVQSVDVENLRVSPTKISRGLSASDSGRGSVTSVITEGENSLDINNKMDNTNNMDVVNMEGPAVRRGKQFQNGDVVVTLLPVNEKFPWVTPARFKPELVPEELMAPVLTLTVEEYVSTLEKLVKDIRFNAYNLLYKRVLVLWIFLAFAILLALLFCGVEGVILFGVGIAWLIINASAIFLLMWIKLKLNRMLEKCMASVNAGLIKHNLLLGMDDRGKLSCHKINLCFIYFNAADCIAALEKVLDEKPEEPSSAQTNGGFDRNRYLRHTEQFDDVEVVVGGRNNARVSQKSERAEKLFLHYSQRWAKDFLRRRLDWVVEDVYGREDYTSNTNPRHLRTALCPCQYIDEHLRNKRQLKSMDPCKWDGNICQWCD